MTGRASNNDLALFRELWIKNDVRGGDAAGIAMSGKSWEVFKEAGLAQNLYHTKAAQEFFAQMYQERPQMVLGHTRKGTGGTPKDNVNNHPFVTPHLVGVHNGSISDWWRLDYDQKLRQGVVDSEALYLALDRLTEKEGVTASLLDQFYGSLTGVAALAFWDRLRPHSLWLTRATRPLALGITWDGTLFFTSEEEHLYDTHYLLQRFGVASGLAYTVALPDKIGVEITAKKVGRLVDRLKEKENVTEAEIVDLLEPFALTAPKAAVTYYDQYGRYSYSVRPTKHAASSTAVASSPAVLTSNSSDPRDDWGEEWEDGYGGYLWDRRDEDRTALQMPSALATLMAEAVQEFVGA